MKYSSKDLKAMARTQLTGKFGTFIGAYVLYSLITDVVSMIINFALGITPSNPDFYQNGSKIILYFVILMLFSLIVSVLTLGFNKMFLDGSRGYQIRFEDLFYGFRHHLDRVILMQLLMVLINLVCCLPGLILFILADLNGDSLVLMIAALILLLAGIVFMIYFALAFSQAMYLMADYDDLGPVQVLKESRRMMVGNKGRLLYIQFSFLGISLLGILSCGLGMLWIFPYTSMTYANFYRSLGNEI